MIEIMDFTRENIIALTIMGFAIWGFGDILNRIKDTLFAKKELNKRVGEGLIWD